MYKKYTETDTQTQNTQGSKGRLYSWRSEQQELEEMHICALVQHMKSDTEATLKNWALQHNTGIQTYAVIVSFIKSDIQL